MGTPGRKRSLLVALALSVAALALLLAGEASAHGGGLNAEGCHNSRKTGEYLCHGGGRASAPARTVRQTSARPQRALGGGRAHANCAAAGAAPVRVGEPGYSRNRIGMGTGWVNEETI